MDIQYKTQGWLEKYGWEAGKGLGKNLDGRSDIVHVSQKKDNCGVCFYLQVTHEKIGVKNYDLFDFAHWDNIYTKAASKIHITTSDQVWALSFLITVRVLS